MAPSAIVYVMDKCLRWKHWDISINVSCSRAKRAHTGQKCWPAHELGRLPSCLFGCQYRDAPWPARVVGAWPGPSGKQAGGWGPPGLWGGRQATTKLQRGK